MRVFRCSHSLPYGHVCVTWLRALPNNDHYVVQHMTIHFFLHRPIIHVVGQFIYGHCRGHPVESYFVLTAVKVLSMTVATMCPIFASMLSKRMRSKSFALALNVGALISSFSKRCLCALM